jgi:hypothetical protein
MEQENLTDAIQTAIEQHDGTDHPESYTTQDVKSILDAINTDILEHWELYQDTIDERDYSVVHEDRDVMVLADHTGHFWNEQLEATETVETDQNGILRRIIVQVHNAIARSYTDVSWSVSDPVVIEKTPSFQAGEVQILREIARRTEQEGSVARAVDQFATGVHGYSKSTWASLTGRNRSSVTRTTKPKSD